MNIALIADDGKKELMVQFCIASAFSFCRIMALISCGVYFLPSISTL